MTDDERVGLGFVGAVLELVGTGQVTRDQVRDWLADELVDVRARSLLADALGADWRWPGTKGDKRGRAET